MLFHSRISDLAGKNLLNTNTLAYFADNNKKELKVSGNDFSDDAFSLTNIRLGRKTHQMQANKHTSLFRFTVSGEGKKV
jgi:hypothetical protein